MSTTSITAVRKGASDQSKKRDSGKYSQCAEAMSIAKDLGFKDQNELREFIEDYNLRCMYGEKLKHTSICRAQTKKNGGTCECNFFDRIRVMRGL